MAFIYKILRYILDIFYPSICPICKQYIGFMDKFCKNCTDNLTFNINYFTLENCEKCISICEYDDISSKAVQHLKNVGGNSPYAFGSIMSEHLIKSDFFKEIDFIIPIPMHKKNQRKRGFNQCLLISKVISIYTHIPTKSRYLKKTKFTLSQKTLDQKERLTNLKDCFQVSNPDYIKGKTILIIDDICTTGSTLSEVARTLKLNGCKKVYAMTFCKTLFHENAQKTTNY